MTFLSRLGLARRGGVQNKCSGGAIKHYSLEKWWFSELSEDDRILIRSRYKPLGMKPGEDVLTGRGEFASPQTTAMWLTVLAGWFKPALAKESDLILRIADKAWEVKDVLAPSSGADAVFSRHLALGKLSEIYYRFRESPEYLERSLEAARLQIAMQAAAATAFRQQEIETARVLGLPPPDPIILPTHQGYTRMAIVLEKKKQFNQALNLVREAQAAEWSGDWEKRVQRLEQRLNE